MSCPRLVVDASVAIKWLVPEEGSIAARRLEHSFDLIAPDLIYAECANIVWKMVRRGDIEPGRAGAAVEALTQLGVQIFPMDVLARTATEISVRLDHPAYDCFYLALAIAEGCRLITADDRLLRVLDQKSPSLRAHCLGLRDVPV